MPKIKKLDEESYIREEKTVFNGSDSEKLKIIQTLICFANYQGGELRIYEVKNESDFKNFFDAASIGNAINSFIEPPIGGVIAVKQINKKKGVILKIRPSARSPHFYKKDGCFINSKEEKIFIFQRGSIGIRRSGSNDVCNSLDFEQTLKNKLANIFGSIKNVVVERPLSELTDIFSNINKKASTESISYTYNPDDQSAVPVVRQILDTEPFMSLEEELNAAVKLWKTNGGLINENLIAKAYLNADKTKNKELIKLLLQSSIEKSLPSCLWAYKIKKSELKILLKDIVKKDFHPSTKEGLKLLCFLPYKFSKKIFNSAKSSRLFTVNRLVEKIIDKIDFNNKDRTESIAKILYRCNFNEKVRIKDEKELEGLINSFINSDRNLKNNIKNDWRIFDLLLYGEKLLK